jgi:flavin reductase (DIM6/NTAB) family NADH-FMN oxidoreductase RutF
MKRYRKRSFPLDQIRRFLEPGPIVLISSAHKGKRNIMTLGWHMMLGFEPAIVGCFIWDQNRSFDLVRKSKQCVINIPERHLIDKVIAIGNTHGPAKGFADKFEQFKLTPADGKKVKAPLIAECYANFECELIDTKLISRYSVFIFECVHAHVAISPKYPRTVHYRGDGVFMMSGPSLSYRKRFKPENL